MKTMSKKIYLTTVKIAVTASSEDEAFESISISLSDNLKERGAILDWQYEQPENAFAERGEYKPDEYEEGQAFVDNYMERVKEALREGRKLGAIKIYKDATGAGLKESKDVIDSLCSEFLKRDEPDQNEINQVKNQLKDQNSKPDFIHFKE